jgi:hypothetical protein
LSLKNSETQSDEAPERVVTVTASPCVRQCCLDDRDVCLGCGRALNEILDWSSVDDSRRRIICHSAQERLRQRQS